MATLTFGILTARTAVSIRCGSAGSWEGVAGGCGQVFVLGPGPAALFLPFLCLGTLQVIAWTQVLVPSPSHMPIHHLKANGLGLFLPEAN